MSTTYDDDDLSVISSPDSHVFRIDEDGIKTALDDQSTDRKPPNDSRGEEGRKEQARHPVYYFEHREFLEIEVQGTLFCVPEYAFVRDSAVYRKWREGTREMPLLPADISSVDFERFLSILFPPDFGKYSTTATEEWISVFEVASILQFELLKASAIAKLDTLGFSDPMQQLAVAKKYCVPHWFRQGIIALCLQSQPLSLRQAKQLPIEELVGIQHARESIRKLEDKLASQTSDLSLLKLVFPASQDKKTLHHEDLTVVADAQIDAESLVVIDTSGEDAQQPTQLATATTNPQPHETHATITAVPVNSEVSAVDGPAGTKVVQSATHTTVQPCVELEKQGKGKKKKNKVKRAEIMAGIQTQISNLQIIMGIASDASSAYVPSLDTWNPSNAQVLKDVVDLVTEFVKAYSRDLHISF